MTLEGQDTGPDETPAPPATTRWQEDRPDDDDVLLPPYVPGRRRPDATGEPAPSVETSLTAEEPEAASSTVEPEAARSVESSPYDFPWESESPENDPDDLSPGEAAEPEDAFVPGPGPSSDDEFPFEAFDIEGDEESSEAYEAPLAAEQPATDPAPGPDLESDPRALAVRVQRLADVLRQEGRSGLEREMSSRDRVTSLMAGVLAGYLAGLED